MCAVKFALCLGGPLCSLGSLSYHSQHQCHLEGLPYLPGKVYKAALVLSRSSGSYLQGQLYPVLSRCKSLYNFYMFVS